MLPDKLPPCPHAPLPPPLSRLTARPLRTYQEAIFRGAGFGASSAASSVVVGAAKLCATLVAVLTVERCGRRPLLFAGIGMMLAGLLVLAAAFATSPGAHPDGGGALELSGGWPRLVVGALMLYVCGYQVGFGPISWLSVTVRYCP